MRSRIRGPFAEFECDKCKATVIRSLSVRNLVRDLDELKSETERLCAACYNTKRNPAMTNKTAHEILKMIEAVDPDDTAKLDEIDARAWCFRHGHSYLGENAGSDFPVMYGHIGGYDTAAKRWTIPQVTRSRDALKAIRPEGWFFSIEIAGPRGYIALAAQPVGCGKPAFRSPPKFHQNEMGQYTGTSGSILPTEELAELHAIIQAIAHERAAAEGEKA